MFVPYGDPRYPYSRKSVFGVGDIGAGVAANNLALGCDYLGVIKVRMITSLCQARTDFRLSSTSHLLLPTHLVNLSKDQAQFACTKSMTASDGSIPTVELEPSRSFAPEFLLSRQLSPWEIMNTFLCGTSIKQLVYTTRSKLLAFCQQRQLTLVQLSLGEPTSTKASWLHSISTSSVYASIHAWMATIILHRGRFNRNAIRQGESLWCRIRHGKYAALDVRVLRFSTKPSLQDYQLLSH